MTDAMIGLGNYLLKRILLLGLWNVNYQVLKMDQNNNQHNTIHLSLLKRKEALENYINKKEAFLVRKTQMQFEIEEARKMWITILEKVPKTIF